MSESTTTVLTPEQAWTQIQTENLGRLITHTSNNIVDVFPINYVCLSAGIMLRTRPGTKLSTVATFPEVVFEVDHQDPDGRSAWSVVIRATAHIINSSWAPTLADSFGLHPLADPEAPDIVVLTPTTISGRSITLTEPDTWFEPNTTAGDSTRQSRT